MSTAEPARCTSCHREVEVCCFCDEACGHELCYRCVIIGLHEEIPEPHSHGG